MSRKSLLIGILNLVGFMAMISATYLVWLPLCFFTVAVAAFLTAWLLDDTNRS